MKKRENNQQSHRGDGQKRGNSNVSRNGQNHNNGNKNSNRNTGHGRKTHESHLWASSSSSSTVLTSHLSMVNRRNQDGAGKNTSGANGTGKSNNKPRVTSSYKKIDVAETTPRNTSIKGTLIINLTQPTKKNHPVKFKLPLMLRRKETKPSTM